MKATRELPTETLPSCCGNASKAEYCPGCGQRLKAKDKVIFLRVPSHLHKAVKGLAHRQRVSINKLCSQLVSGGVEAADQAAETTAEGPSK